MKRLNKTEPAVFLYHRFSVFLKVPFFQIILASAALLSMVIVLLFFIQRLFMLPLSVFLILYHMTSCLGMKYLHAIKSTNH